MDSLGLPLSLPLATGLAWGSGFRLYATVMLAGLAQRAGWMTLPANLQILAHPVVIGIAGLLALVEFVADKIPYVDSAWDAANTFLRIPVGTVLSALALGTGHGTAPVVASAVLGLFVAGTTHAAKLSARAAINTSPEPLSNVAASVTEDAMFVGGGALLLAHPYLFGIGVLCLLLLCILLIRNLFGVANGLRERLQSMLRTASSRRDEP